LGTTARTNDNLPRKDFASNVARVIEGAPHAWSSALCFRPTWTFPKLKATKALTAFHHIAQVARRSGCEAYHAKENGGPWRSSRRGTVAMQRPRCRLTTRDFYLSFEIRQGGFRCISTANVIVGRSPTRPR